MLDRTLHAFYDLEVNPTCFDIMKFLVLADLERREKQLEAVHVVFVPASGDGFRKDDFNKDVETKRWRLRQLMVAACPLLKSCRGVTVCASRDEATALVESVARHVFPTGYTTENPIALFSFADVMVKMVMGARIPSLYTPQPALEYIDRWLAGRIQGKKPVSITLREMDFQTERNSNLAAWAEFAQSLEGTEYEPIIIRDTQMAFEPPLPGMEGMLHFSEPTFHLELRSALYERCHTNLMIANGPIEICMLNKRISFVKIKVRVPSTIRLGFPEGGILYGEQHPLNGPGRLWWWEDDTFEHIRDAFETVVRQKEAAEDETDEELFDAVDLEPLKIINCLISVSVLPQARVLRDRYVETFSQDDYRRFAIEGKLAYFADEFEEAVLHLKKATSYSAANGDTYYYLSLALKAMGCLEEALAASKRSIELEEDDFRHHIKAGEILEALERPEEAVACYKSALSWGGNGAVIQARIGALYESLGKYPEALASYMAVREILKDDPRPYEWSADVLSTMGRFAEARDARTTAFRLRATIVPSPDLFQASRDADFPRHTHLQS